MGTEIWRDRAAEAEVEVEVEGKGREIGMDFFRVLGRKVKESLLASGSSRYCSEKKESRPMVGRATRKDGRMMEEKRKIRRKIRDFDISLSLSFPLFLSSLPNWPIGWGLASAANEGR